MSVYGNSYLESKGIVPAKMCDLALISKGCFNLIRKKTLKVGTSWKFIKGVFM